MPWLLSREDPSLQQVLTAICDDPLLKGYPANISWSEYVAAVWTAIGDLRAAYKSFDIPGFPELSVFFNDRTMTVTVPQTSMKWSLGLPARPAKEPDTIISVPAYVPIMDNVRRLRHYIDSKKLNTIGNGASLVPRKFVEDPVALATLLANELGLVERTRGLNIIKRIPPSQRMQALQVLLPKAIKLLHSASSEELDRPGILIVDTAKYIALNLAGSSVMVTRDPEKALERDDTSFEPSRSGLREQMTELVLFVAGQRLTIEDALGMLRK